MAENQFVYYSHPISHTVVFDKAYIKPISNPDAFMQAHTGFDLNFDYLVNNEKYNNCKYGYQPFSLMCTNTFHLVISGIL